MTDAAHQWGDTIWTDHATEGQSVVKTTGLVRPPQPLATFAPQRPYVKPEMEARLTGLKTFIQKQVCEAPCPTAGPFGASHWYEPHWDDLIAPLLLEPFSELLTYDLPQADFKWLVATLKQCIDKNETVAFAYPVDSTEATYTAMSLAPNFYDYLRSPFVGQCDTQGLKMDAAAYDELDEASNLHSMSKKRGGGGDKGEKPMLLLGLEAQAAGGLKQETSMSAGNEQVGQCDSMSAGNEQVPIMSTSAIPPPATRMRKAAHGFMQDTVGRSGFDSDQSLSVLINKLSNNKRKSRPLCLETLRKHPEKHRAVMLSEFREGNKLALTELLDRYPGMRLKRSRSESGASTASQASRPESSLATGVSATSI